MKGISKKIQKLMALFLVLAMTVALAACGDKPANNDGDTKDPGNGTSTEDPNGGEEDPGTEALDPVTLNWYVTVEPQPRLEAVVEHFNKLLAEKRPDLNVTVNLVQFGWGEYLDKIGMKLQTGEEVDLFYSASWWGPYNSWAAQGYMAPMDDLLAQYGQNITSQLDPKYLDGMRVAPENKIFGIPNFQGYVQPNGWTFRKDLVDKYNFDYKSVKNLRDLEPFLEQIKANEPDVTPILLECNSGLNGYSDMDASLFDGIDLFVSYDVNTGKAVYSYDAMPELTETMKIVHEWYQKGYIAADAVSKKDAFGDECKTGRYAVMQLTTYYNDGAKTTKDYGYETCDAVVNERPYLTTGMMQGGSVSIGKTCKNPERAMMLLDAVWADKELYNALCFGIEGEDFNFIDDEKTTIELTDPTNANYGGFAWELGNAFNKYYTVVENKDFMDIQLEYNEKTPASPLVGFSFDQSNVQTELASLSAIFSEVEPVLYSGSGDPEKMMPELKDRVYKAGLQKVIDEAQAQIDAWKATK